MFNQAAFMKRAIVRTPARTLPEGLSQSALGVPNYEQAIAQHASYCAALERCGVELTSLAATDAFPDSTFVEDTAVLTKRCAILTRPGAPSRLNEVDLIEPTLKASFVEIRRIAEPGTLDGGDVCEAGNHYLIGISERTNEVGAKQLGRILGDLGASCSFIDIRDVAGLLHLKSGLAWLGDNRFVVTESLKTRAELAGFELIQVATDEQYAANCVRINERVLIASGYPKLAQMLDGLGYQTISLEMSEFQKLDGGLSCLSLRF
jgi:dimethylargininase